MLPLEDLFTDVISKAQRGLGLDDEGLAARTGIPAKWVASTRAGKIDEPILRKLAIELNLHPGALLAMARKEWAPLPVDLTGLAQFTTPYEDMTVNSYIAWDPASRRAAAFDTGADAAPMIEFIARNGLSLSFIFLTHTHPDHIAGIGKLSEATGCKAILCHEREPLPEAATFDTAGTTAWQVGVLEIEPRLTWGHSKGGVTYVVRGLRQTVAIVGDAIFASSMGGGGVSYADALLTNRREILSLPDSTIVCPGHGPMTTIGEEKAHNPFFPEYKPS